MSENHKTCSSCHNYSEIDEWCGKPYHEHEISVELSKTNRCNSGWEKRRFCSDTCHLLAAAIAKTEKAEAQCKSMQCCGNCKHETYDGMDYGCGTEPEKGENYKCLTWEMKVWKERSK